MTDHGPAMSPEDWPSSRGRQAKESMGYGEAGLDSMGAILEAVQALQGLRTGGTFFDLGSGRGHAVLAAATFPAGRRHLAIATAEVRDERVRR